MRIAAPVLSLLFGARCGESARRVADRALGEYRQKTGLRPMPSAGSVRIKLRPAEPGAGEDGTAEIEWEGPRYRETVTSAGISTISGIQAGKAFSVDEDGVTRATSEPMLGELRTRSFFWRRAYLFDDHERARLSLGPTDASTLAIDVQPRGGLALRLVFDRSLAALRRVESPRFRLDFDGPSKFRDVSRTPVAAEVIWNGLPTRRLPDPAVGGAHGRFAQPFAEAPLAIEGAGISIPGEVAGQPARIAIDADAVGPLRISPELARKAGLATRKDVFGRRLASGVTLRIGTLTMPGLAAEVVDTGDPAIDAVAGGVLYRESVVEIDPDAGRVRIHDPEHWVLPESFGRNVIDDDGDLPVAVLYRGGHRLRLRLGTRSPAPLELAAPIAEELGLERSGSLSGLVWGTLRLPPIPTRVESAAFAPAWGDHGALGWRLLASFHLFVDMPHRWVYVRPRAADSAEGGQETKSIR